ncbi:MAG TPA: TetR family transcriptional regulator [Acidimicrobiia bacterium]|nr:TetR family transcriptional regulator [Acidimicrobiia bacterium]
MATTETLTANQAARRERVLEAAMDLAGEGGYDAVQMRDVAARAQVALGTIYRYFSSKDHLLAACQLELWRGTSERFVQRPPEGDTAADRVVSFLRRAMRAAEREPRRTAALVLATSSPDPAVRDCQLEVMALIERTLFAAMGDIDPDVKTRVAVALRQIWHAILLEWVNEWSEPPAVGRDLESAARLLLDGR